MSSVDLMSSELMVAASQRGADADGEIPSILVQDAREENQTRRMEDEVHEELPDITTAEPVSSEDSPPPLPPRPKVALPDAVRPDGLAAVDNKSSVRRPQLNAQATTTAVSLTDVFGENVSEAKRASPLPSTIRSRAASLSDHTKGANDEDRGGDGRLSGEARDSGSVRSYVPTIEASDDLESLLDDVLHSSRETPAWKRLKSHIAVDNALKLQFVPDQLLEHCFDAEFAGQEAIDDGGVDGGAS